MSFFVLRSMSGVLALGWNGSLAGIYSSYAASSAGPPGPPGPPSPPPGGGAGAIGGIGAFAIGPVGLVFMAICWIAAGTSWLVSWRAKFADSARMALSTA